MTKIIYPGQTIGIIGGGQLGRMMALAAKESGFKIAVLEPAMDSPCGQVADVRIVAPYDDEAALEELAEVSDVITYEFENIDYEGLKRLSQMAYVPQGAELVRITQNRITEKEAIVKAGCPVAPYIVAKTYEELVANIDSIGYPCIVKTASGGYDGKGQQLLKSTEDLPLAKELFTHSSCIAEGFVPFVKEVSVIVQRNGSGESYCQPVGENIHVHHILHETIVPARITESTAQAAEREALKIADYLHLVGTLAVEMFVLEDGGIVINELAPRPHNSGHYSIEACNVSQFHQHIRAVCGWPLRKPELWAPSIMINVLGQHVVPLSNSIAKYPEWSIHLYGKAEAKVNRKMGHVTIMTKNLEETLQQIESSGIWSE
ncbi:5-(carboxyamino)imidazole ribonucleotide synthase [Lysinibacillus sp. FSL M8-0216]|uniref:N5-carboxyaminoimidazole ribonucleotide synthase n=1 Tax=Lysinibacillus fusiformis TaxID=28031 RepID=A0A1H9PC80_9BACI|nr:MULTISPECIES: 5-(carboxyamino)imidazole ribonucleotide synthase [Lysinibacillus]EAZ87865.1 phosphoribosylaminoimidazole carboxylase [Bacillus sp. B14905]HAU32995.1 5-(carboxyamino)imidazole ribonucleotide synthase [Lysinibacillus sp.]MCG7437050.1 5-(carboxyamino)imidazole ribonucleotide synthase [Lysinibacillus fusiformis]MED4075397.1 5-(carboxyamino)imidazole ribonucleotide synthase [Lysinibacillus fusiformis]MED4671897.1 5-(carboxyamino)imidazole ribonucleotide synthase [Lysinibacillus fu